MCGGATTKVTANDGHTSKPPGTLGPNSLFGPPYSRAYPHDAEGRVDPTTLMREQLSYLHCWPSMEDLGDTLAAVRRAHLALEDVYLMTNGEARWVCGLRELLEDGWKNVRSSRDLVLSDTTQAVSQGVDMAVGNWAEAFVGNGVCKCTFPGGIRKTVETSGR